MAENTAMTFEEAMTRLNEVVETLERGNCSLDESMKLFEEGTRLTAYCSELLKTAEQKIIKLTGNTQEAPLKDKQGVSMGEELS